MSAPAGETRWRRQRCGRWAQAAVTCFLGCFWLCGRSSFEEPVGTTGEVPTAEIPPAQPCPLVLIFSKHCLIF